MSIVSNIIDALRRIGSPSERSALRRQDAQLEGEQVLERGRLVARDGEHVASGFRATVAPAAETVVPLDDSAIEAIEGNAALAEELFEAFDVDASAHLLDKLDHAFQHWLLGADRHGYTETDVVEILGAAFGNHCNETLDMQWVEVSDKYGVSLAVDGREIAFRAFPYASIEKRIAGREYGFFRSIHLLLGHQRQVSRPRGDAG